MKQILQTIFIFLLFTVGNLRAQVGIGTTSPNNSAVLDLSSSSKGLLIPRMSSSQRTSINSPAKGLMVFDNDSAYFFYYTGSAWQSLKNSTSASNFWSRTGSSTTLLNSSDNVGIGKSPSYKLDVSGMANSDSFGIGGNTILNAKGSGNLMVGSNAGIQNSGSSNTLIGIQAGQHQTTGSQNTFLGDAAGADNQDGANNTNLGFAAGLNNVSGSSNVCIGVYAGASNTASNNIFLGFEAGYKNIAGSANIFTGYTTGFSNSTGSNNIFSGYSSGAQNTSGSYNICSGSFSGFSNTTASCNLFFGVYTGFTNSTGEHNLFIGHNAGTSNSTGSYNVFSGSDVANSNTTGTYNVFEGFHSGNNNSTGNGNTAIGTVAGYNSTGSNNTFLGDSADAGTTGLSNATAIGYNATVNKSNSLILGNNANVAIGTGSPDFPLDIQKSQNDLLRLESTSGGSGNKASMVFLTYGASLSGAASARIGAVDLGSNNGGLAFEVANSSTQTTSTSEAMRILNTGYIGINTTSPNSMFEVKSGGMFSNGENYGLIVDESGSKRVGFMKYSGHEGGIWRTASQDFEIGRTSSTSSLPEGSVTGVTFTTDFYVSGSGQIGIGTGSPNATLDVRGSINTQRTEYSSSATIASTDHICAITTTSSITLTLPDASTAGVGREYIIKSEKSTAGITISTTSSQTIDGASSKSISTGYGTLRVYSDGSNWFTF